MDPLTHTLVGASLAATSLGKKTTHASAALVIGANLPDVDVLSYFWGEDAALGFRRGWTHGIPALVLLPLLLAGGLWLWSRWRPGRESAPAPSVGWLVALTYLAILTHPALDWLNTYGMRWLMPFDDRWFYGDAVFIMDPWLWLGLGVTWLLGRGPTRGLLGAWSVFALLILLAVGAMAPSFVPLVLVVAVVTLGAIWVCPRGEILSGQRLAAVGLTMAATYIAALLILQARAEGQVRAALALDGSGPPVGLMVGPVPADPLTWDVVAIRGDSVEHGRFSWRKGARLTHGELRLSTERLPRAELDPAWREARASGQIPGFLAWVRFPWIEAGASETGESVIAIMDARYVRRSTTGFGSARVVRPPRQ